MHILLPETDNCLSWISWWERKTVENISWSISAKECYCPGRAEPATSWSPVKSSSEPFRLAFFFFFFFLPPYVDGFSCPLYPNIPVGIQVGGSSLHLPFTLHTKVAGPDLLKPAPQLKVAILPIVVPPDSARLPPSGLLREPQSEENK